MKITAATTKRTLMRHVTPYRLIVGTGFIAAMVLILATPLQMPDPDDWAYYLGARNFSQGHFTISALTEYQQSVEIGQEGGVLLQYLPIGPNKWALEKAPGTVFYLVPFEKMGIPRYGNVLLAFGMIIVTFTLLKRLRDEKAAMTGSLLILFTPISLVMLNRVYMDTYPSLAFLAMGGGLYIYYHLERNRLSAWKGGILLFLACFFTGWSVIARYTNLPVAVILALHLVVSRLIDWRRGREIKINSEIIPVVLGIGIPLAAILLYDYYVFGSPFRTGYSITPYPIKFAFQYLGQVDANGQSIPWQIFWYNLQGAARNWLIGFPLLIIGIPAFFVMMYRKIAVSLKRSGSAEKWSSLRTEMPWDVFLVLTGWFICVFLLYLTYEWTAGLQEGGGFVVFDRFCLPGLFPVMVVTALMMARFPYKILIPVMTILVVYGGLLYAQWALDLHILPGWLSERNLMSRWPGYIFPPWSSAGQQFYPWPPARP
jgi:hypothetical protein